MHHQWLIVFTVSPLLGMACSDSGAGLTPASPSGAAVSDASVISALIASELFQPYISVTILVRDSTAVNTSTGLTDTNLVGRLRNLLPSVDESTQGSFLARNSRRVGLQGSLRLGPGMMYFRFSDRGPTDTTVLAFSRAGFNSDGTQALVYVKESGHFEGFGRYYLLRRYGGRWEIERSQIDFLT